MPNDSTDPKPPSGQVTLLLRRLREGDDAASDDLVSLLYGELRRLARRQRPERAEAGLQTTALVHEAYLKLFDRGVVEAADRGHFLCLAARAMRQIVVDAARTRTRQKRGGDAVAVSLADADMAVSENAAEILAVNQALDRLRDESLLHCQVVECRYFAGLSEEETAAALGRSLRSVQRAWQEARKRLRVLLA